MNFTCTQRLYEIPAQGNEILYHHTGARIFATNELSYGDSVVVSGGEIFSPLKFVSQMPSWAQTDDVNRILEDVYSDQQKHRGSYVGSQSMPGLVMEGLRGVYPPEIDLPSHFSTMVNDVSRANYPLIRHANQQQQLPGMSSDNNVDQQQQLPKTQSNLSELFGNIYLPTINVNSSGLGSGITNTNAMNGKYNTASPNSMDSNPRTSQQLDLFSPRREGSSSSINIPSPHSSMNNVSPTMNKGGPSILPLPASLSHSSFAPQGQGLVSNSMMNQPAQAISANGLRTHISPHQANPPLQNLQQMPEAPRTSVSSIASRLESSKTRTTGLAKSGSSGDLSYKGGIPDRISSHKAAERRSRAKLKDSLKSLCLSIPALREVHNPSKAVIMQQASEYIKNTVDSLEEVKSVAEKDKEEKVQLAAAKASVELQLEAASITTVEITDSEERVVFVDHMWEIVMGYSRAEVVGSLIHSIVDCSSCPFMSARGQSIKAALANGEDWKGVMLGSRRDGQSFACEATTTPIPGCGGSGFQYLTRRRNFHLLATDEQEELCSNQLSKTIQSSVPVDSERVRQIIQKATEMAKNTKVKREP
ncbi:hypothetical protein, variant [Sphaeroforma arctica JP610]|uniref:BHLH domain-containing protein n=1 Tax=Sphaeroforma arctica JP610 TaxID=667725 RepID=A0A0L0GAK5_9EUKA|nr:hypothetical protein, variant [Sphaeroforma arctica JP610]KNC86020.1 hypothetical protein, variant [Sphaeroforma arctica JP610]|eukprot:XP_014159922.1 hypothetical protein, variant [Sphaeroforma arctica JP610]